MGVTHANFCSNALFLLTLDDCKILRLVYSNLCKNKY